MKYRVGIDLGGTNIRLAVYDEAYTLVARKEVLTEAAKGADQILDKIEALYTELTDGYDVLGVGIGCPGPVVAEAGVVAVVTNIPGVVEWPIGQLLNERLGVPVYVGNDANVAGMGEATKGAGQGKYSVQYITISTGIGGGFIEKGQLLTGYQGFAQEIGNILLVPGGQKQSEHMNAGCFEAMASGTAVEKKAKEEGYENAKALFDAARLKEAKAMSIVDEFVTYWAMGISILVNVLNPEVFVLGGGIIKSSDVFLDNLRKKVDDYIFPALRSTVRIEVAALGQDAGLIGAAALVVDKEA